VGVWERTKVPFRELAAAPIKRKYSGAKHVAISILDAKNKQSRFSAQRRVHETATATFLFHSRVVLFRSRRHGML
jgi:hypothetical protein